MRLEARRQRAPSRLNLREASRVRLRRGDKSDHLRAARQLDRCQQQAAADHADEGASRERMQRLFAAENAVHAADQLRPALPRPERKSLRRGGRYSVRSPRSARLVRQAA